MKLLTMSAVLKVRDRLQQLAPNVEVIGSNDPRRQVILGGLSLAHLAQKSRGWDREHAAQSVSLSLPAMSGGLSLPAAVAGVPVLGGVAAFLTKGFDHPLVSLSPDAESNPVELFDTLCHEFGHHLQLGAGGLVWCAKYVLHVEFAVLAAEVPCYGTEVASQAWFNNQRPDIVANRRAEAMRDYGATDAFVSDARRMLMSHAMTVSSGLCPAVRTLMEGVRVLRAEGYTELPAIAPAA